MIAPVRGVVEVERLGEPGEGPVDLVVEVPHGADRLAHYQALRARLLGALPADLEEFFCVNTDVGAWQVGRRVAELHAAPGTGRAALVLRSLLPRTFIDCNRIEDAADELAAGGLTAGVPAYVRDAGDRALLLDLHRRYLGAVEQALALLSPRGFLLLPHSYGPVSLGIERVDDDIVAELRRAHQPERYAAWPARPEVDLITRTADGTLHASAPVAAAVAAAYRGLGLEVGENATYHLHPSTQAYRWAARLPGRSLCLEIRRDRLVREWVWNRENEVDPEAVERFAAPLARAIATQACG